MTIWYALVLMLVLGGVIWFAWQQFGGFGGSLFSSSHEARIGVSEVVAIDGKRKLFLVHRDGVEHLIMIGGPVDVVIEQGIVPQRRAAAVATPSLQPAYEPRFTAPAAETAADPTAGFGRLRQRSPQPASEPHPRPESTKLAGGSGGR